MYSVLLVIHVMVTLALIGIILVQRSASDGMGLSGSSSNNFMSGRAAATFVTRATAVLASLFIVLSLGLGILTAHNHAVSGSIVDRIENSSDTNAPVTSSKPEPVKEPSKPAVPRPE